MALSRWSRLAKPGMLVMLKFTEGTTVTTGSVFSKKTVWTPPGPTMTLWPDRGLAPTISVSSV